MTSKIKLFDSWVSININKAIQLLLGFLFLMNLSEGLFAPLFAIFITENIIHASLTVVGLEVAFYSIAKSILQIPLARYLDLKKGERDEFFVIAIGALIGVLYPISLIFIREIYQLYAVAVINGLGGACLMAAYYALFSHHIDRNLQGLEWSLFSVAGLTVSAAVGGVSGGILADNYGFPFVFTLASIINLAAFFLLSFLYPRLRRARGGNKK